MQGRFKPLYGDVNDDGEFGVADVVKLQKWLVGSKTASLEKWKAGDFTDDKKLNGFDLILMRRALVHAANYQK